MARDGVEIAAGAAGRARRGPRWPSRRAAARCRRRPARHLVELTGGNPLFVVECARASSRSGGLDDAVAALPPTVRQVVLDRVALLPDATRDALASGAVLGREFTAATIARMHDSEPVRVIDTLLPAVRAGILRETRPGPAHLQPRPGVRRDLRGHLERPSGCGCTSGPTWRWPRAGDGAEVLVERARHALAAASGGAGRSMRWRQAAGPPSCWSARAPSIAPSPCTAGRRGARGWLPAARHRDELLQVARDRPRGRPARRGPPAVRGGGRLGPRDRRRRERSPGQRCCTPPRSGWR